MSDWTVLPEGARGSDKVSNEPLTRLYLKTGQTLRDLLSEGVWFTHGPVIVWPSSPVDPLSDFYGRQEGKPDIKVLVYNKAFFAGLEQRAQLHWNHTLLFCPTEHWARVSAHMRACVLLDTTQAAQRRFDVQEIQTQVSDWPYLDNVAVANVEHGLVPVTVFSLSTPYWVSATSDPVMATPTKIFTREK